jgi:LysM repeat protein
MIKFKETLTALRFLETRFGKALIRGNITRFSVITLILLIASVASAQEKIPSGTVEIDETQLAFIIGGDVGKGILHYRGVDFYFKTSGIKVGGIGITKISAVGEVYDLFDIDQFPGTYVTGNYGIALGGGVGGLVLKNENGVYLRLRSTLEGVALAVGLEGMTIKLEDAVQAPVEQVPVEEAGQTYTVQSGDTLYEIANRFGTTVSALKNANNLTSDMIRVGQVLNIP